MNKFKLLSAGVKLIRLVTSYNRDKKALDIAESSLLQNDTRIKQLQAKVTLDEAEQEAIKQEIQLIEAQKSSLIFQIKNLKASLSRLVRRIQALFRLMGWGKISEEELNKMNLKAIRKMIQDKVKEEVLKFARNAAIKYGLSTIGLPAIIAIVLILVLAGPLIGLIQSTQGANADAETACRNVQNENDPDAFANCLANINQAGNNQFFNQGLTPISSEGSEICGGIANPCETK